MLKTFTVAAASVLALGWAAIKMQDSISTADAGGFRWTEPDHQTDFATQYADHREFIRAVYQVDMPLCFYMTEQHAADLFPTFSKEYHLFVIAKYNAEIDLIPNC